MLWAGLLLAGQVRAGAGLGAREGVLLTWVTPESLAGCRAAPDGRERDQEAARGREVLVAPGTWDEASDTMSPLEDLQPTVIPVSASPSELKAPRGQSRPLPCVRVSPGARAQQVSRNYFE